MKAFIVVIAACVIASSAFAVGIVWESDLPLLSVPLVEAPKGGHPTNDTEQQAPAQNVQQSSPEVPFPLNPQPRASSNKNIAGDDEQGQEIQREANALQREENRIQIEANAIQEWIGCLTVLLVIIAAVIGVFQAWILFRQTHYMREATRYAGDAAIAAKESVEVARDEMKIANRAYLSVKEWKVELHPDIGIKANCRLSNAGHTPATLLRWRVTFDTDRNDTIPPPLTPACLREKRENETIVSAQGNCSLLMGAPAILPDFYRGIQENFAPLYLLACFIYSDVFGQKWWVSSTGRYVSGSNLVFMIEGNDYNCSKEYKEEEWNSADNKERARP